MKNFLCILLLSVTVFSCKKDSPVQLEDDPVTFTHSQDIVMYEIFTHDFSSEGTFQGVVNRLDSVKALGANTIWLMPIHPIGVVKKNGTYGSPYAVKDYFSTNTTYGTIDNFKTLVTEAHNHGLAVVIDWVANHTAWDNAWITSHKDWYSQDGGGNIIIPPGTNWADVADLNFNNQTMRQEMITAMKFWVTTANIDGFRCDYADGVPDNFWKQAIDSVNKTKQNLIWLAEGGSKTHFSSGFQMNYSWNFYDAMVSVFAGQSANNIFSTHTSEYSGLPVNAQKLRFTTNHDKTSWEKTPPELFGGLEGAKAASVLSVFMGGVPLLYNGQEVGSTVHLNLFEKTPINWNQNPGMVAFYKSILKLYNENEALRYGTLTNRSTSDVAIFDKTYNNQTFMILVNTRNFAKSFDIVSAVSPESWINTKTNTPLSTLNVLLGGYGYLILKKTI